MYKQWHHMSFSFPLSSFRNSTWMRKLEVAKWSVENMLFRAIALFVMCQEVSSPSGVFWQLNCFLWRPFYNRKLPKGGFLKKWAWSADHDSLQVCVIEGSGYIAEPFFLTCFRPSVGAIKAILADNNQFSTSANTFFLDLYFCPMVATHMHKNSLLY